MTIGLLIISTGKYGIFLQPLINDIEKHFFVGHKIDIYLFTDSVHKLKIPARINIESIYTEHKPFPLATLYRYKYFAQAAHLITSDFVFYSDVDMAIVNPVGAEILPDGITDGSLVATLHPGFYNGGGSWEGRAECSFYTLPENRKKYYAGGFQGGRTKEYLEVCQELSQKITEDESKGIIPIWHDESAWNWYLSTRTPKALTPEYCMVEEKHLRERWGIAHFTPRIIALKKDHAKIRG